MLIMTQNRKCLFNLENAGSLFLSQIIQQAAVVCVHLLPLLPTARASCRLSAGHRQRAGRMPPR